MNAQQFFAEFKAALSANPAPQGPQVAGWTGYIADCLLYLANHHQPGLHVCSASLRLQPRRNTNHEQREYLYDFTLFEGWNDYSLPAVLIEHENQWSEHAFMLDFWKLLFGWAPLRVMIGYASTSEAARALAAKISLHAADSHWRYPADTEDLVLIGHGEMDRETGWTVVIRTQGTTNWSVILPP